MTTIERIDRVIGNCREAIATAQSWNDNRPDESPLDCELERVALFASLRVRRALISGDMVAAKRDVDALIELLEKE